MPQQSQYQAQQPPPGYGAPGPQDYGQQPDNGQQQAYGGPGDDYDNSAEAPTRQPLSAGELEQLVAPLALYPDQLLAQILTASTYPAQVAAADQWLRQMNGAGQDQIVAGANAQSSWDPSVKALTAFPQVLDTLNGNLQWTTALGNAYYNQPQDVLETVQELRQRAEQAGNLESTPQQQVMIQDPGYIAVQPADPQTVYVPTYDPWAVYGEPVAPYPGFSYFGGLGSFAGDGVQFGMSYGMGPFMHTPFWLGAWGLDWMGNAILFNRANYWTRSRQVRDWGFERGGLGGSVWGADRIDAHEYGGGADCGDAAATAARGG